MALSFEDSLKANKEIENDSSDDVQVVGFDYKADNYALDEDIDTSDVAVMALGSEWTLCDNYKFYEDYSDDDISSIDSEKNISLNRKQINITQESNSQFIPFEMPRFYDGFDLTNAKLLVHFVNQDGYESYSDPVNVYKSADKIRFGWLVGNDATAVAGNLSFEIQATGVNSKGEDYIWKSKIDSNLNVLRSLSGNGVIKPDNSWMTSFITLVNEKVADAQTSAQQAQTYANNANTYANNAKTYADNAKKTVDTAKNDLSNTVQTTVDTKVKTALSSYYTKTEVDKLIDDIDISDQLQGIQDQIDGLDGLAKFKVEYDGSTMTFYNGTSVIKSITVPSAEYIAAVNNKIDTVKNDIQADLDGIHSDIDGLPESLATDYYKKTDVDSKFATKESLVTTDNKVSGMTSSIDANSQNISTISKKVVELETAIGGIDQSSRLTYDATYDEDNVYTLWEIENEGKGDSEVKTAKAQFKIQGGGGGGGTSSTLKIEYITATPIVATLEDKVVIKYNFSGTDSSGDAVMEGTATWRVGGTIVATNTAVAGENSFDVTDYLVTGTQKVNLSIVDDAGSLVTKSWTVQKVDVRIESTFNDKLTYPIGKISFDYTPYGAIQKTVHFVLDGKELGTVETSVSGVPLGYELPSQAHGAHLLEVYMTAEINGNTIESNHIMKDIIWYNPSSDIPVVGCVQQKFIAKQYDATNIVYTVYDPSTETPEVTLAVDGKVVSTLTIDSNTQTWQYKSSDVGQHTLTITCGKTVKTIVATIEKLDVDIEPVTAGLAFDFNPTGKSNNDADRLWSDGDVAMTVSDNFDWVNGGYQIDENGDQYFCVKAGTSAVISYNLFADDARRNGKEFKLVFKTTNVAKSDATFLTCQSGDTSEIGLQMNVHEAYIKSNAKSLYIPYSEEDIIEWEFNINKDTEIPIVMSYEDGTPCRPMSYTSDYSFTQENPVPITIGSSDCDVMIYRMKAYSTSLTSSAILSNFIADARTASEMIDRYNRNQIYDENNLLTPESVAAACPDMRIIKIEAPHFTNNKKDFVGNTSFECIYKNGDQVLDNWKFANCYHSGRTTPCPLHMETYA